MISSVILHKIIYKIRVGCGNISVIITLVTVPRAQIKEYIL